MIGAESRMWRRPRARARVDGTQRVVVVTDVDGSLLEPGTRAMSAQQAAFDFLAGHGIPVVVNSSRTRAEIERLQQAIGIATPFISEHGSALFLPRGSCDAVPPQARPAVGGHVVEFGRRYHEVVDRLRSTCRELSIRVTGFAELSIDGVAHELGVPMMQAQLAKLREYTELFRIEDATEGMRSRLFKALRRHGLRCWPAGPLHLVTAARERAEGLRMLRTMWRQTWGDVLMVGIGDSEDDVTWLSQTDVTVVVQRPGKGVPARVLSKMPTVRIAERPGRQGWSDAIFTVVGELVAAHHRADASRPS
jgi:mannosyl-3-phosphoglycerate phosphatase family protein